MDWTVDGGAGDEFAKFIISAADGDLEMKGFWALIGAVLFILGLIGALILILVAGGKGFWEQKYTYVPFIFFGAIVFVGLGILVVYALLQIIESIANRNVISAAPHKKSKDIAVVLAALFGPFSWLYVWKDNSWKFWLNLCLIVVTFGGWYIVAWLWAILDMAIKPVGYYQNYEINQNPDDRHIKHVNSEVYGEAK